MPDAKPPEATYAAAPHPRPEAIVVHCSDPRFLAALGQFIQRALGLETGRYIPIVVAGGVPVLARPYLLPQEFRFLRERLERHRLDFPSLRRAILINHQDCKYYEMLKSRGLPFLGLQAQAADLPRADLAAAARAFAEHLAPLGLEVELYHALFADPEQRRIQVERVWT
jgi:hypothetical protein